MASVQPDSTRMPVVFLSHGAPPLADDSVWSGELSKLSTDMGEPTAILVVSAHWEQAPLTIAATTTVPLYYDFYGFPERYYNVQYPAPEAPGLADRVRKLLERPGHTVHDDPERGLDHGAYVPLVEMYPDADVPVLQISMPTLDPATLLDVGRRMAPLRDEGVLIIGSGFSTHNLREADWTNSSVPGWSSEFDDWLAEAISSNSVDELVDFRQKAPAAFTAHPTSEHFAPLFVSLGATLDSTKGSRTVIDGFWYGLSKRSVRFE